MDKRRLKKLTVLVPEILLRRAKRATKSGATPTVRKGLELLAARDAYDQLLKMRGRVKFRLSWQEMRGEERSVPIRARWSRFSLATLDGTSSRLPRPCVRAGLF